MPADFKIEKMWQHADGFYVAEVLSYHSQQKLICHNRYGSWSAGDPNEMWGKRRDLRHDLCASLASYRSDVMSGKVKAADPLKGNPFAIFKPKTNPFAALAPKKPNPFAALGG